MSGVITESFALNLKVMKKTGLYPPDEQNQFYKVLAYLMYITCVVPNPILAILYLLLEEDLDMERVRYNAGFVAQSTCFITKLLPFIRNGQRLKNCINYFESPYFTPDRNIHKDIIMNCIKVCKRNTLIFFLFELGGTSSWAVNPIFWKGRFFPVDVWLPFNATKNTATYLSVYFIMAAGCICTVLSNAAIDPLLAGLAYHATSQIKILTDNLKNLSEYADEDMSTNECLKQMSKNELIYQKIKQCIQHHNKISRFVKDYEDCFSSSMFSQFAASVLVICFCCLQLSRVESLGYYVVQLTLYFSVILAQIYFCCYYGTLLIEESDTITNAIYMGKWYDYDRKSKKALMTLMVRSKKPASVAIGKIIELSLFTFTTILRRSYSLIAVMKNYQ